jgi:hypothetical protein
VIAGLAARPDLFRRFLAARRGPPAATGSAVLRLGWQLLAAGR